MERSKVDATNIDKFVRNCDYHHCSRKGDDCIDQCDFNGRICIILWWRPGDIIPDICYESQRENL